ncbi:MAG TPA: hypothetical protein VJ927_04275 [Actinomycetota bacterium]|nr:hypothetical protein [Actinomycetota bacterium]
MSASAIQRQLHSGAWLRMHPATYRLREAPPSWEQALMAGCLWAGPGAAASHRAAARLHQLGLNQAPTEIVSVGNKRSPRSVRFHRTKALEPCDVTRVRGIPVTTGSRTLIDLGGVVSKPDVERALEAALRLGLTSIWHLIDRLDAVGRPGRNGVGVIRAVLRDRDPRLVPTASELESMLWQIISSSDLPLPERQFVIFDAEGFIGRCDFVYPADWLVIEGQSARWHLTKERWLSDMERRNRLTLAGWRVIEVPWLDIVRHPEKVIARIAAALVETKPGFRA